MAGKIDSRLKELGITLPEAPMPAANYVPFVRSGNLVFVSGQIPMEGGKPQFIGKLGRDFQIEDGQKAARPRPSAATSTRSSAACGSAVSSTPCPTSATSRR